MIRCLVFVVAAISFFCEVGLGEEVIDPERFYNYALKHVGERFRDLDGLSVMWAPLEGTFFVDIAEKWNRDSGADKPIEPVCLILRVSGYGKVLPEGYTLGMPEEKFVDACQAILLKSIYPIQYFRSTSTGPPVIEAYRLRREKSTGRLGMVYQSYALNQDGDKYTWKLTEERSRWALDLNKDELQKYDSVPPKPTGE